MIALVNVASFAVNNTHKISDDDNGSTAGDSASINNAAILYFCLAIFTIVLCFGGLYPWCL